MKDSFQFYRSFFQTIEALPVEMQRNLYRAIALYGLDEEEMELGVVEQAVWYSFKAQLDANWRRYYNGCKGKEYGAKGGNTNFEKGKRNPYYPQEDNPKDNPKDNPIITPNRNININTNTNSKENIVVVDVDGACTHDDFKTEVYASQIKRQQMCCNLRISDAEFERFATEVFNEWEISNAQDWSWSHFINTMRVKVNAQRKQEREQKQRTGKITYSENKRMREQAAMELLNDF